MTDTDQDHRACNATAYLEVTLHFTLELPRAAPSLEVILHAFYLPNGAGATRYIAQLHMLYYIARAPSRVKNVA
jgi:hypothetical protein